MYSNAVNLNKDNDSIYPFPVSRMHGSRAYLFEYFRPLGSKIIDRLLVHPVKASSLLTDLLITG